MLRVSKLTDYATVVMTCLAAGDGVMSAQALAERARLELPTVSKVLKQLAQAGLVASTRGINGGYRLARAPDRITIADVVTAMEGPIGMTECSAHAGLVESFRGVNGGYRLARPASEISLAQIVEAMEGPIGMTECSVEGQCGRESQCGVRVNWQRISQAIAGALASVTIADMLHPPTKPRAAIPLRVAV
jgi:FeS assembly SUF system regulator